MKNDDPFPDPATCYDNFTDEDLAAQEAEAEAEDRAAGKDSRPAAPNDEGPALLVCQDCGAVTPWEDWLDPDAFECCPKCGSHNAKLKRDDQ